MQYGRKLKSDLTFWGLLPAAVVLFVFATAWIFTGRVSAHHFLAAVYFGWVVLSFVAWYRTRNAGYLLVVVFQFSAGFWIAGLPGGMLRISAEVSQFWKLLTLFSGFGLAVLLFTKRLKWRARELFELAAQPVEDVTNGFTASPRATGQMEYTRSELSEFAEFMARKLIALPYVRPDGIVLVPLTTTQSYIWLYGFRRSYHDRTWILLDYDGNISVSITQQDYLGYKDNLSFDQLCTSMGKLLVEFFEMYRRGEGTRIIDRMNDVREHPFS